MAQLGGVFDANTVPPDDRPKSFDVIPNGWQNMHAIESDYGPTKTGNGQKASFTFEILDGPYKGRRIWQDINVLNKNAQAQSIGQRELADFGLAIGVPQISDTEQAHFRAFQGRVGTKKDDKEKNEIKAYRAYNGAATSPTAQPAQPAASPFGQPQQVQQQPQGGASQASAPWPKRA